MMKDKPYFFPHDTTASNDPKMMVLWSECGLAGIGAFWILIENIHQTEDGRISLESMRSYLSLWCSKEANAEQMLSKVEQTLFKTQLLVSEGDFVTSKRVLENKKNREILSKTRSDSGKLGAEAKKNLIDKNKQTQANAEQMPANAKQTVAFAQLGKERKGKEKKEKTKDRDTAPKGVAAKDAAESGEVPFDPEPEKDLPIPHLKVLSPDKSPPPHVQFVESFKKTYEGMTHQPFKADNKHYAMVAKLFKSHGQEAVIKKAEILGRLCEQHKWPANDGWKNFTIERISNQWNAILESSEQTGDQKLIAALQAQEKKDAEHRAYMASR